MNINEINIPTPESDALIRKDALKNLDNYPLAKKCRNFEKRLTIARWALDHISKQDPSKPLGILADDARIALSQSS